MVWVRKISPTNVEFSSFSPVGQKNLFRSDQKVPGSKLSRRLIYRGSKVSSGWVGSGNKDSVLNYFHKK